MIMGAGLVIWGARRAPLWQYWRAMNMNFITKHSPLCLTCPGISVAADRRVDIPLGAAVRSTTDASAPTGCVIGGAL